MLKLGGTQKREHVRQLRVRKLIISRIFMTVKESAYHSCCDGERCAKQANGAALLREGDRVTLGKETAARLVKT